MHPLDSVAADPAFQWNARTARHLLNRAGFGVPPSAIAKLAAMKPEEAVAAFVDYERFPDKLPGPTWLPRTYSSREMRRMESQLSEEERRRLRQELQREAREAIGRLQIWWLNRMCHTQRPLEEKLALFWHGHFATSAEKVTDPSRNYHLNEVFRRHGAGNFRRLVTEVGRSPAMLRYLDQAQSNRQKPNENWARELMELFTLGIGHYTETDIKEAARAFTGWTERDGQFHYEARRHDPGLKTFLGRTGYFGGDDIIAIILEQPACAEFICRKLWTYFAYENPEPEIVEGLADTLRRNDYELKPVLRRMFLSRAFYSDKAVGTQIKSPAQLVANLLVQLDAPLEERPPIAQLAMRAMGQSLFSPPNVKGWDGGRAWINTNTLLVRYNFASYLVSGVVPDFGRGAGSGQLTRQLREALQRKSQANARQGRDGRGAPVPAGDGMMMSASSMEDEDPMMMMAEMMMTGGDDGDARLPMPAGQDAMPPDNPSRTLYGALRRRQPGNRAREKVSREMEAMALAPFQARGFFSRYEGMTAGEMVDHLIEHFIGFPLEESQREKLIAVLSRNVKPGQPLSVTQIPETDLRAAVQLLLSTAEYQVC